MKYKPLLKIGQLTGVFFLFHFVIFAQNTTNYMTPFELTVNGTLYNETMTTFPRNARLAINPNDASMMEKANAVVWTPDAMTIRRIHPAFGKYQAIILEKANGEVLKTEQLMNLPSVGQLQFGQSVSFEISKYVATLPAGTALRLLIKQEIGVQYFNFTLN